MGQYIKGDRRGVTLYYDEDDTDVVHLYKDDWHIRPSRFQHPPPPVSSAIQENTGGR
jgi:hypothetical protein